jgi:hypothetical protein
MPWWPGMPGCPQAPAPCCRRSRWASSAAAAGAAESLTRGRRGAFLVQFDAPVNAAGLRVAPGDRRAASQVQAAELARRLAGGAARQRRSPRRVAATPPAWTNCWRVPTGCRRPGDPMAAAHHRANVLFNIMRGGVFVDGTRWSATTCWPLCTSATTHWARR